MLRHVLCCALVLRNCFTNFFISALIDIAQVRACTRMCKIQLLSFLSTFCFYKQYAHIFARKKFQFAVKLCVEHSGTYSLYLGYGYPMKYTVPLFSISTLNLHVPKCLGSEVSVHPCISQSTVTMYHKQHNRDHFFLVKLAFSLYNKLFMSFISQSKQSLVTGSQTTCAAVRRNTASDASRGSCDPI